MIKGAFLLVIHGIFCLVIHVDLILISLSVPDDAPVSLHTFHHSSVHVVSHSGLLLTILFLLAKFGYSPS